MTRTKTLSATLLSLIILSVTRHLGGTYETKGGFIQAASRTSADIKHSLTSQAKDDRLSITHLSLFDRLPAFACDVIAQFGHASRYLACVDLRCHEHVAER